MQLIKYIFRVAYNPRHQNSVSKPRFSAPAQIQFSIRHLPPGFQMPRSRKCHVVEMQTYFGYVTVFSTRKYICAPRQLSTCWLLEDQVLQHERGRCKRQKEPVRAPCFCYCRYLFHYSSQFVFASSPRLLFLLFTSYQIWGILDRLVQYIWLNQLSLLHKSEAYLSS